MLFIYKDLYKISHDVVESKRVECGELKVEETACLARLLQAPEEVVKNSFETESISRKGAKTQRPQTKKEVCVGPDFAPWRLC